MLTLRSSGASPFVRKVRIAAAILGLADRIAVVEADTMSPAPDLLGQNPLGKIPALVLDNGETLYDSRVILEYLDALAGGGKIIPQGWSRFGVLRLQALADGIMDAGVLQMYEIRWRPEEHRVQKWVEHQKGKVARALDAAEGSLGATPALPIHVGHIALACALGYLDLRFEGTWRQDHPRLVAWLDGFAGRVPAFEATRFKG
jgi:glutathione S-transferase